MLVNIGDKTIEIIDMPWDEEAELIVQIHRNKQYLIYGRGDYPVGIKGDSKNTLEKIGLRDRLMKIKIEKYFYTIAAIELLGEDAYLKLIRTNQNDS